jgi:alkaline phosphatase D
VTAPRHAASARIAVTSCQHYEQAWFTGYRDMIAAQPT